MRINKQVEYINDFLSLHECMDLISRAELIGFEDKYRALDDKPIIAKKIRNSQRVVIDDSELAEELWSRAAPLITIEYDGWQPVKLNKRLRFYRYTESQWFRLHKDMPCIMGACESKLSFIIYLNEEFEGGCTNFRDFKITPQAGRAAMFDHMLLHEGAIVKSGVKYIVKTDVMFEKTA